MPTDYLLIGLSSWNMYSCLVVFVCVCLHTQDYIGRSPASLADNIECARVQLHDEQTERDAADQRRACGGGW